MLHAYDADGKSPLDLRLTRDTLTLTLTLTLTQVRVLSTTRGTTATRRHACVYMHMRIHAHAGKSPLDYARYYCHKEAAEYLRGLMGGGLTRCMCTHVYVRTYTYIRTHAYMHACMLHACVCACRVQAPCMRTRAYIHAYTCTCRWEEQRLVGCATRMQALRRGVSSRKEVIFLRAARKERVALSQAQQEAAGAFM